VGVNHVINIATDHQCLWHSPAN